MDTFAGFRSVEVIDGQRGGAFSMAVFYPTAAPATTQQVGPFTLELALDAPLLPGPHPTVLISHGSGGSPLTHRLLAHHLARHGFVVGLPEHPGNNRNDNALAGTIEILANRPRHITLAADWLFASSPFTDHLRPDAFSLIGHSLGGYTALAVAGGNPTALPEQAPGGDPARIAVTPDPRVRSLVLLAPATPWFRLPGALCEVTAPILLLAGERDEHCPPAYMPRIVLDGLPAATSVDSRIIPNAGHFSFLSPWPAALTRPDFPPSQDPPGFDRAAFMPEMNALVVNFLLCHP